MKWPDGVQALLAEIDADAVVLGLLGGPEVYATTDIRQVRVPSVGYTVIVDTERENTDEFRVQWDWWIRGDDDLIALEKRLRELVTARIAEEVQGVWMWMEFLAARDHPYPDPGVRHRSMDVRYELARDR